jgi:hypothetical protein
MTRKPRTSDPARPERANAEHFRSKLADIGFK